MLLGVAHQQGHPIGLGTRSSSSAALYSSVYNRSHGREDNTSRSEGKENSTNGDGSCSGSRSATSRAAKGAGAHSSTTIQGSDGAQQSGNQGQQRQQQPRDPPPPSPPRA